MQIYICPKDFTHARDRFVPDYLVSLQNPHANVSKLRPPWIPAENHYIGYFCDEHDSGHADAPTVDDVREVLDWLTPRCGPDSEARFIIHCDAGLGRSPAVGYLAWSLHLGPGKEAEAFEAMRNSSFNTWVMPNPLVISYADDLLARAGALRQPLEDWNSRENWTSRFK